MSPLEESRLKLRVCIGDIDMYPELNNGRHLTLMDLGRLDLAARSGVLRTIHKNGWGLVVGGASLRYRRKLPGFSSFEMRTKWVGADEKWLYFHQRTIRNEQICSAALVRTGVLSKEGLVEPHRFAEAMGLQNWESTVPDWVEAWIKAEGQRPWPSKVPDQMAEAR